MQKKFLVHLIPAWSLVLICATLILIQPSTAQAMVAVQEPDFPISVNVLQASNLRELPTSESDRVGGVVGGAVLEIVGCNDSCEWYQLESGEWVAAFLVSEISIVGAGDGRPVANGNANLRAGPSTDYLVAGGVLGGQVLDIIATSEDGTWYQLSTGQWIADFLVDNAPEGLPVGEVDAVETTAEEASSTASADTSASTSTSTDTSSDSGGVDLYDQADYEDVVICSCEADYYDCDGFYSQPQAQACYNYCLDEAGDIHDLDSDGNALACEGLPGTADSSSSAAASADTEEADSVAEEEAPAADIEDVEAEEAGAMAEEAPAADTEDVEAQEEAAEEATEEEEAIEEEAPAQEEAMEEPAAEEAAEEATTERTRTQPAAAPQAMVSVPTGFTVEQDTDRGYSLALPRGWTVLDLRSTQFQNMLANFGMGDMAGDLTAFLDSEAGQAIGMVAVTDLTATFFGGLPTLLNVSLIEVPNATPEWSVELVDALIKANTEALGDVQILDLAPDVINNLPAVRASVIVGLDEMGIQGELFAKVVGLITPERIYVLTLGTTPDRTAEREPVFDQIIGSFGPMQ